MFLVTTEARMAPKNYLGEFEHMLLLAILRKGADAFAVEVRRELASRS